MGDEEMHVVAISLATYSPSSPKLPGDIADEMMPPLTGPDLTVLCGFFLTALVSGIAVVSLAAGVIGSLFYLMCASMQRPKRLSRI